jgi:hypothetical protein
MFYKGVCQISHIYAMEGSDYSTNGILVLPILMRKQSEYLIVDMNIALIGVNM